VHPVQLLDFGRHIDVNFLFPVVKLIHYVKEFFKRPNIQNDQLSLLNNRNVY